MSWSANKLSVPLDEQILLMMFLYDIQRRHHVHNLFETSFISITPIDWLINMKSFGYSSS